jgi:GTP-binding protein
MVEAYLQKRESLRAVVVIMDLRHPPTTDDLKLWGWLREQGIPGVAVLTKADKATRNVWEASRRRAAAALAIPREDIIVFSATTKEGRPALWERLILLARPSPEPDS